MNDRRNEDLVLVERVLAGERDAVDRFVERMRCVPRFVVVLNRSLGLGLHEADLDDLVQSALTIVWRKLGRFEGRARLETWVYRIVRWELMNDVRRRRREPEPGGDELVEPPAPTAPAHDRLDYDCLMEALEGLAPDDADAVRLRHFEHLTFAAIARRRRIPVETAKSRYYRALRNLEQVLAPRFGEERA